MLLNLFLENTTKCKLIQFPLIKFGKTKNLIICKKYIPEISRCRYNYFPRDDAYWFSTNILLISKDKSKSETICIFQEFSKFYNIGILFGVVIKDNNKALNKSIFINKIGDVLEKYSKIHTFGFQVKMNI